MSQILVTGASGLLGTEFCRQLKLQGHEIWALDNHSRSQSIPACDHWLNRDLLDPKTFANLPSTFERIYHYSAINGTANFYQRPLQVLKNNLLSDLAVFDFAAGCGNLEKLVYASSSEIVADSEVSPVPEQSDIVIKNIHNPRWSYRLAKIASENYLANTGLPWLALRYFNVYGENSKPGHFLGDQIHKIQEKTFSVTGADETRSFCYVRDAVEASIWCSEHAVQEVINIGNDREITIGQAVKILASAMGYPDCEFEHLESPQGSVKNRRPDISRLRELMPFYNPISWEQGIEEILRVLDLKNSSML